MRPPDGAWGVRQEDNTWSGMVGMVYRKVGDCCCLNPLKSPNRSQVQNIASSSSPFGIQTGSLQE